MASSPIGDGLSRPVTGASQDEREEAMDATIPRQMFAGIEKRCYQTMPVRHYLLIL
jgi:hypothetical protein